MYRHFLQSPGKRRIVLRYEDGRVKSLAAIYEENSNSWSISTVINQLKCDSQVIDTAYYGSEELFVGASLGAIAQCHTNDLGELEPNRIYQLKLKCAGARMEGVQPLEQYKILRRAAIHYLNDE